MTPPGHELWLRVRAPFAAFRWLQAGVYRATSPTITPSAAWGLVLNMAGIETRGSVGTPITLRRDDVPRLRIAIGELKEAQMNSVYQQLHGYPVGNSGAEFAKRAHGSKFWIVPVRREVLTDVDFQIGVRTDEQSLIERIKQGLAGGASRYGLPFLGDNNFLIDRIDCIERPLPAQWFCRLDDASSDPARNTCRLTVDIDRKDSSRTRAMLFQRGPMVSEVPAAAWTTVPAVE